MNEQENVANNEQTKEPANDSFVSGDLIISGKVNADNVVRVVYM